MSENEEIKAKPKKRKRLDCSSDPYFNSRDDSLFHTLGRTRIHDRDKVFAHLLDWALEDGNYDLNDFCILLNPPLPPSKFIRFVDDERDPDKKELYSDCLGIARAAVCLRREKMLSEGKLHHMAYSTTNRYYNYFAKMSKQNDLELESAIKNAAQVYVPEEYVQQMAALMAQISSLKEELKMAKTKASEA